LNHEQDLFDFEVEKVSLMSIHASKELEFSVVFIAGCEENFIPFLKNGKENRRAIRAVLIQCFLRY
jgi:DNA helicase-2/ATP-dependent DNA helicase PcrA